MRSRRGVNSFWGLAVSVLAFLLLYAGILADLVRDWIADDNYSHGFLVIPAALYLVWEKREQLRSLPVTPSHLGVGVILGGIAMLLVGTAGIEMFLTRVSLVIVLAGAVIFLLGWAYLRLLAFPLAFLLLMIPLPAIIFNNIAFPLQLVASQLGVGAMRLLDIPVLREGNVIVLANTTLEVAEACSGIRSLVSLFTVALLFAYFSEPRVSVRVIVALSSVPFAILTNGLRVASSGVASHYYGPEVATGVLHDFSGWVVFAASCAMVFGLERGLHVLGTARLSRWAWRTTEV